MHSARLFPKHDARNAPRRSSSDPAIRRPRIAVEAPKSKTTDDLPEPRNTPASDIRRLVVRHRGNTAEKGSLFATLCSEKSGDLVACGRRGPAVAFDVPRPALRLLTTPQESMIAMLDDLRQITQSGSGRLGINGDLSRALDSFGHDYRQLHRVFGVIRRKSFGRQINGPVRGIDIPQSGRGWMTAMAQLAGYRKRLTGDRIAQLTSHQDASGMRHQFTQLALGSAPSSVHIHNTKKANGEGATRVMSFVGYNRDLGTWEPGVPHQAAKDRAFARADARGRLRPLTARIEKLKRDVGKLESVQEKLADKPQARANVTRKLTDKTGELRTLEREHAELAELAAAPPLMMLDLSYDDLHTGLRGMCQQYGWSDRDLATCLLHMLGEKSRRGARLQDKLQERVTVKGIKVKDVVDPRQDTRTGAVTMSGNDLCMTLMSIMFLTEPKHALPMAIANRDALRAVKAGAVPLNVLFDPIELADTGRGVQFRIGSSDGNLGSMLASANNQRVVLDPSAPETRVLKEQSMPSTEALARRVRGSDLPRLVDAQVSPDLRGDWGHSPQVARARQSAFMFPFLKSVAMRAMIERKNKDT